MPQRSNLIIFFGIGFFLIGGAIVFLVLNGEDDGGSGSRNANAPADVTVFVASEDIPANTVGSDVIEQGLLTTKQIPAGTQPVGAITNAADLTNKIFAVPVAKNDVVTNSQLAIRSLSNISIPEGFDGVAVSVPYTNGGAGYIAPGDRINIYGLFGETDTPDAGITVDPAAIPTPVVLPRTELLLTNVLVLDVNAQQSASFQAQPDPANPNNPNTGRTAAVAPQLTYLLAMTPSDIERLVQVSNFANMYFSLTAEDAPPATETFGSDSTNVNGPVSAGSAAPQG